MNKWYEQKLEKLMNKKFVILLSGRESGKTEFQRQRLEKIINEDLPKKGIVKVNLNELKVSKKENKKINRSILISIQPKWVAKILNGEKTIEVRKKFPKDYVGWVYIYCTKGKARGNNLLEIECPEGNYYKLEKDCSNEDLECSCDKLNGYVVARFWCERIAELECEFWEEPLFDEESCYQAVKLIERDLDYPDDERLWNYHEMVSNEDGYTDEEVYKESKFLQKCCLNLSEIKKYLGVGGETRCFGIHISRLEVFDTPRLLTMFRKPEFYKNIYDNNGNRLSLLERLRKYSITEAPQNYCYVEENL